MTTSRPSRFDQDPEVIAWARAKVQAEIDRADELATQAAAIGDAATAEQWAFLARALRGRLLGDTRSSSWGQFDERLAGPHRDATTGDTQ
jgi:hypothetical protein